MAVQGYRRHWPPRAPRDALGSKWSRGHTATPTPKIAFRQAPENAGRRRKTPENAGKRRKTPGQYLGRQKKAPGVYPLLLAPRSRSVRTSKSANGMQARSSMGVGMRFDQERVPASVTMRIQKAVARGKRATSRQVDLLDGVSCLAWGEAPPGSAILSVPFLSPPTGFSRMPTSAKHQVVQTSSPHEQQLHVVAAHGSFLLRRTPQRGFARRPQNGDKEATETELRGSPRNPRCEGRSSGARTESDGRVRAQRMPQQFEPRKLRDIKSGQVLIRTR